jgi:hypothetical protein
MSNMLTNLLFAELVIIVFIGGIFMTIEWYKHLFPYKDRINEYEREVDLHLAESEEEIYDEGFIEDINSYDSRISDMKEYLKTCPEPPVEIITDEYERSIER